MYNTKIAGLGYYVPERIISNSDLEQVMDTTDEWIQERTGIQNDEHRVWCFGHKKSMFWVCLWAINC